MKDCEAFELFVRFADTGDGRLLGQLSGWLEENAGRIPRSERADTIQDVLVVLLPWGKAKYILGQLSLLPWIPVVGGGVSVCVVIETGNVSAARDVSAWDGYLKKMLWRCYLMRLRKQKGHDRNAEALEKGMASPCVDPQRQAEARNLLEWLAGEFNKTCESGLLTALERKALEEIVELAMELVDMETLVSKEVEDDATLRALAEEDAKKKARDRIHQRHRRARLKL